MNQTPFEKYGALKVSNGKLTDLEGKPVKLRGISTHNLSLYPEYVNEAFLLQVRDEWGAELIRLAMYTAEENGYCTGNEENRLRLLTCVKDGVKLAEKLGMYVIVDWHILSDSNPLIFMEQAEKFWDEMSAFCKDYRHVIYEICNEPNVDCTWADVKKYAEKILPIIRRNDPDKVILVGTPVWSQRLDEAAADPAQGFDNLMYVLHFYADSHREPLREIYREAHAKGLPVFVSEFGTMHASGNGEMNREESDSWLDLLDADQISYCIWNISNKDESSAFFKPDCKKVSGFTEEDLSEQAKWYLERLKKNRD